MALTEIGYDGGTIEVDITGFKNKIIGIEKVSFGIELDTTKIRGSGGGWHRGYAGPGFKIASDGTMDLWTSTYNSWLEMVGGEDSFLNTNFDVTIRHKNDKNAIIKTVLKNCRPKSAVGDYSMSSAENLLVSFAFTVVRVDTTIG